VAFFNELLTNLTTDVPGYRANDTFPLDRALLIKNIEAIKNQEELHAIAVNAFLVSAKQQPISPCQYRFPVTNFKNAMFFAQVFTDLALSTIPAVQLLFARDGGTASRNVLTLGSILGQEGQQDGYFRSTQQETASAAPFLTGGTASIAYNALIKLIVEDSCPQPLSDIGLPRWGPTGAFNQIYINNGNDRPEESFPLWISANPEVTNGSLPWSTFQFGDPASMIFLSGQNIITVPATDYRHYGGNPVDNFRTEFPFDKGFANGLTIAILARGNQSFATANAAAEAAILGPVLIEMN
ncbi:MAG: hypothetical protein Q9226_009325, partial [Calogaya cf. arnoldii]